MTAHGTVLNVFEHLAYGTPSTFENMNVVPLLASVESVADYLTLDDALAAGVFEIREVSEGGSVPNLTAINHGNAAVLLVDGEELLGAKQNRVVNLSILIAAGHTVTIPVSCVESGRWHHRSRGFTAAPRTQFAEGRAARMRQVTHSLAASRARVSDQGAVWSLIADKASRLGAASDTSAMAAMFDKHQRVLEEFVDAFPAVDRQVGVAVWINSHPAGIDFFDATSTWRKLGPKFVRSYALDAIDRRAAAGREPTPDVIRGFMSAVQRGKVATFSAVGEGDDVRFSGEVDGAALVARGRVIHASVFPAAQ